MKILDATEFMHSSQFDWGSYFEKGKSSLKKEFEENPEMWQKWTNSDKRYMLVTDISIIENDFNKSSGTVTDHFDAHISSDSILSLKNIWLNFFSKRPYDNAKQHFIADMKEKRIIEFCSVCM